MNIKVSNTNGNNGRPNAVRVYVNGVMVAEVFPTSRNPLSYIRSHNGKYRAELIEQCKSAGMSDELILEHVGV